MTRHRRHRGYVLLLTLLLLAVAATALAGVCRAGLRQAVQASRAQEDLQRRWGVVSCRATLLRKAPRVLDAPRPPGNAGALSETRLSFTLGGLPITAVFGDEQAKVNLNLLHALHKQAGADRAVRKLAQASRSPLRVELRPLATDAEDESEEPNADHTEEDPADEEFPDVSFEPVFASWSQVFPGGGPEALVDHHGDRPSVTSDLTCWSDGMLNVRRASRQAIETACEGFMGASHAGKLVSARDKDPEFHLWETIDALDLPEAKRDACELLLTDESTSFSLWIITRDGRREWYHLAVADVVAGTATEIRLFSW